MLSTQSNAGNLIAGTTSNGQKEQASEPGDFCPSINRKLPSACEYRFLVHNYRKVTCDE